MAPAKSPSLDRQHTVPELLDFHYEHNPTSPIFVFSKDGQQEITEISYLEFVRACHRLAHIIRPHRSGIERAVVAVVALVDTLVYETVIAGTMKAGLVPILISPRNTPAAVVNLLKKSGAHRLLTTYSTLKDLVDDVKTELESSKETASFNVTFEEVPSLDELYPILGDETASDPFQPYPPCPVYPDLNEIAMYFHSSGSTGFPKAVSVSHVFVQLWAAFPSGTELRDYGVPLRLGSMALPPFHGYGFYAQLSSALFNSLTVALYPPTVTKPGLQPVIPTSGNILAHLQRTNCNCLITVPSMIQAWSHSADDIDILRSMEVVIFAGGPLPLDIGDHLVSAGVHLRSLYGATEFAIPCCLNKSADRTDWQWHKFSEKTCINWAPQGDGTFECQFLTVDKLACENMTNPRGFATSDLFVQHPTKKGLWKVVGRIDDVLVHTSGEKTVPAPMENILLSSPLINGAIMFGRQRDQPGVLIEPVNEVTDDPIEVSNYRNKIWPIVEKANQVAPAFSRIYKEMILVTSPTKPLPRTPKGTVTRKAAIKDYEKEIDQIYAIIDSNASSSPVSPPTYWGTPQLQEWLTEQVQDLSGAVLSPTQDIFENGFDSLSATILRLRIVSALRSSHDPSIQAAFKLIGQNIVYDHPSIESLAHYIIHFFNLQESTKSRAYAVESENDRHIRLMGEMIARYSDGLRTALTPASDDIDPSKAVVLLTGSTGNLGAEILSWFLDNSNVHSVYVLNRPSTRASSLDRHKNRFSDKGLNISLLETDKMVFLEGDSALPKLGLSDEVYDELKNSITLIIHNAWNLNFNLSLSSFETHVCGVRNLIDLGRASRHASSLRFLFTSSIASTQSWDTVERGPCPEDVIMDVSCAVGMGYGEGKYVSERILAKSGLRATSFRIGQITGGMPNGAWAMSDWFPMLVKSSLKLQMFPDAHGVISWIPPNAVAEVIVHFGLSEGGSPPAVVNLVHPHPIAWSQVIRDVRSAIITVKNLDTDALPLVPFRTWAEALENFAGVAGIENEVPAAKIIDFFQRMAQEDERNKSERKDVEAVGMTSLATDYIQRLSSRIHNLTPISGRDAERWVRYWERSGL